MVNKHSVIIELRLLSYWHIGSGMGRGADADAVVLKGSDGLPYLPGRTLKGLLREAFTCLEESSLCKENFTAELFGDEGSARNSAQGCLMIGNASLPEEERMWLNKKDNEQNKNALYDYISFTALDDSGLAKDMSLRTIEVTVPLILEAEIAFQDKPDAYALSCLEKACSLVRAIGSHRNRGLGRCECLLRERSAG